MNVGAYTYIKVYGSLKNAQELLELIACTSGSSRYAGTATTELLLHSLPPKGKKRVSVVKAILSLYHCFFVLSPLLLIE